ncbi:MAG: TonB-dependent receptor [Byssovorax sp.]
MLRCRAAHLLPAGSIALFSILSSSSAHAQGTGVVTGTILDASTKKPLADAVVTVTSPALQGEQVVVTDGSGSYRIPNLPPGDYTLRIDRDTFRPYARGGISMRSNSTIRVNAELLPETVTLKAEEVVVVGKAPTVDVGSSSTGVTLNSDFTSRIALNPPGGKAAASRSFESLAAVAPGANADTYGVSINGTTSPENAFQIDGVSVNDPAFGILGTPLSVEFVKEVGVISGGYMPEYGRAMGGILDVVTKSGSNEFHGSVFFNITPGALEGHRETVIRDGSTIVTTTNLGTLRDFGAEVGGPIIKDKLWFFAGVQSAFSRYKLTRSLNEFVFDESFANPADPNQKGDGTYAVDPNTGFTVTKAVPGSEKVYYADEQALQYIAKLTYLINANHNVTLSVYGTPTESGGNGTFGFDNTGTTEVDRITGSYSALAHRYVASANDVSLKYSGAFDNKRKLLDITFGWHHQRSATLPSDGSEIGSKTPTDLASQAQVVFRRSVALDDTLTPDPHSIRDFESVPGTACQNRTFKAFVDPADPTMGTYDKVFTPCPVSTYALGGPGFLDDASLNSYQGRAVFTNLFTAAGHHVLKAGADLQVGSYSHLKAYSGGDVFRENGSGSNYADYRQYGFLTGPDTIQLQDTFTARTNSTTVGGFVQDSWQILDKVTLNVGVRYDAQMMYGADGKIGLSLPNQWSPRVGVIYDFTQQGRSKIFANYARYYEGVPLDIADRSFPGETQASVRHRTFDPATGEPMCDPIKDPNSDFCRGTSGQIKGNAAFGNSTYNPNQSWQRTGGDKVPVDPDISAQSSDEFVVGGEYEVFADARVGANYTHRYLNRAIEDMSRDEANTYFIGNPGYGAAADFPKAKRDYDAVTVFFQKAFSNNWLAQVSYTASWLRGNYAGLFRPETGQLDPNINSDFDLRSLLPNRDGPLPGDRTHSIKVYGAKDFILPYGMDVLVGATFRTRSGSPLNYFGSHPLYGTDEVFILPRGSGGRNDWIHNFDLRVGYSVKLSKESVASITMDIFNLFNFQGVTSRDQSYTFTDVLPIADGTTDDLPNEKTGAPGKLTHSDGSAFDVKKEKNPNFGNPTSYQDPRQFRFGAKVTF